MSKQIENMNFFWLRCHFFLLLSFMILIRIYLTQFVFLPFIVLYHREPTREERRGDIFTLLPPRSVTNHMGCKGKKEASGLQETYCCSGDYHQ